MNTRPEPKGRFGHTASQADIISMILTIVILVAGFGGTMYWLSTRSSEPNKQETVSIQPLTQEQIQQGMNAGMQQQSQQTGPQLVSYTTPPQALTLDQFQDGHWHTVYNNGLFGVGMWDASIGKFHMLDGSPDVPFGSNVIVYAHVDETVLVAGAWYWECSIPNYAIAFADGTQLTANDCFVGQFHDYDSLKGYTFVKSDGQPVVLQYTHGGFPVTLP
jgi:hypothetical protein